MSVAADYICSVGIDDLRDIAFIARMTVSPGDIDSVFMPRIALTVTAFVLDLVSNNVPVYEIAERLHCSREAVERRISKLLLKE